MHTEPIPMPIWTLDVFHFSHSLLHSSFFWVFLSSPSTNLSKDAGLRATAAEVALIVWAVKTWGETRERRGKVERDGELEGKGLHKVACFQDRQLWDALIKGAIIRAASDKQRAAFISICSTQGRIPQSLYTSPHFSCILLYCSPLMYPFTHMLSIFLASPCFLTSSLATLNTVSISYHNFSLLSH